MTIGERRSRLRLQPQRLADSGLRQDGSLKRTIEVPWTPVTPPQRRQDRRRSAARRSRSTSRPISSADRSSSTRTTRRSRSSTAQSGKVHRQLRPLRELPRPVQPAARHRGGLEGQRLHRREPRQARSQVHDRHPIADRAPIQYSLRWHRLRHTEALEAPRTDAGISNGASFLGVAIVRTNALPARSGEHRGHIGRSRAGSFRRSLRAAAAAPARLLRARSRTTFQDRADRYSRLRSVIFVLSHWGVGLPGTRDRPGAHRDAAVMHHYDSSTSAGEEPRSRHRSHHLTHAEDVGSEPPRHRPACSSPPVRAGRH